MIYRGDVAPGQKLPSERELAESLGVARLTVSKAYEELAREEFVVSSQASGTFVRARKRFSIEPHSIQFARQRREPLLSQYGRRICSPDAIEPVDVEICPELNYSAAHPEQLPLSKWKDHLVRASRSRELTQSSYLTDVLGYEPLRRAIANYLNRARGVRCTAEQLVLFSGAQPALDLISRILLDPGDIAAVENPGFPGARRTFASYGATILPVETDEGGMVVDYLIAAKPAPKIVYLTPGHHDPLGYSLSDARRRKLLQWAQDTNAFIVEDDFDGEYRYGTRRAVSLQSVDQWQSVIYISTFWKVMFPVLRLGFLVVPPQLLGVVRRAKSLVDRDFHFIEHEAFANFINEGDLERHISKTKRVYARRRETLIAQFNKAMPAGAGIDAAGAGTHLILRLNLPVEDDSVLSLAKAAGLPLVSSAPYYAGAPRKGEFLLPFAHIDEESMRASMAVFARSLSSLS